MKSNQKKTGKVRRILAATLSVMMLATSGFTTAWAEETVATVNHYPGSAAVIANDSADEAQGGMLYWQTPINAPASTALYKWDTNKWTEISGANPDGTAVTDLSALYKIVNTFEDGVTTEYTIQKNNSGQTYVALDGYSNHWAGVTKKKFVGVTGADSYEGGHSLKITNWGKADDGRFSLITVLLAKDQPWYDSAKDYQLSYYWKTKYKYGMPLYFMGTGNLMWNQGGAMNTWSKKTHKYIDGVIDGRTGLSTDWAFGTLSYLAHDSLDAWIDKVEIYELDASGEPTGENLVPYGDFELRNGATSTPVSAIANISYDGISGGVILDWAKDAEAIGTRVYNADGRLVAELGDATELPITGLTDGESYTYELRTVYYGGYECAGKTVTAVAGVADKPEIGEYYPINLTARNNFTYTNSEGAEVNAVRIFWTNPNLNGIDLTGVKFYNISGETPVEKVPYEELNLKEGCNNVIHLTDTASALSDMYRVEFAYDDGTKISFTTQPVGVKWGNNEDWEFGSTNGPITPFGRDNTESHSGSYSMMQQRFASSINYMQYNGDKSALEAGKEYEVSFWYKTMLPNNITYFRNQYAWLQCLGTQINFPTNDSYDWTKVTKRITAKETGAPVRIRLETDAAVWVDDLSIKLVDSTSGEVTGDNLISDSSFEGTQGMSEITDATYVGTDGGVKINWTRTDNSIYGTHVYLDGVRIAEVYGARQDASKPYVNSTLPITGLKNGQKYTIALKDVAVSGREFNGAYITVTAGEGNGTDLYMPDAVNVKETTAGVNLAWYNPWNTPSKISFYDVTAKKAVEVKTAVVLNANNEEVSAGTPEMSLEAGKYNYVTVVDSKGTSGHTYKLTFEFADGAKREYYVNAQDITGERVAAWQNAYACKPIAHFAYTNDAIGNTAYSFGRYYWNYGSMSTNTPFYYRGLDGALEAGKTYRVAFKMKGKELSGSNTLCVKKNATSFNAVSSKNWLQYYVDITATETAGDTYVSVNGAPYMMIDDFEVYELAANGIPVAKVNGWGGDFESDLGVKAVTDAKVETASGGVKLSWTLPEIPEGNWDPSQKAALTAIGANVYSDGIKIASIKGTELELTDLEPGKDYTFEVRAINVAGYEAKGVSVNFKIAAGVIVSSFDIYDDNTNETTDTIGGILPSYTVKATVSNLAEQDRTVMIAYAMYDENDKLLTIKQTSKTIDKGAENEEISAQYIEEADYYLPGDVSYAKIFLWDMTDNMKPISNSSKLARVE